MRKRAAAYQHTVKLREWRWNEATAVAGGYLLREPFLRPRLTGGKALLSSVRVRLY